MKLIYLLIFGIIFNYSFCKELDSSRKIMPFIKTEFGIGGSNVLFKPKNEIKHNFYANYEFNFLAGFKIKDYYLSSGLGVITFSYQIKHIKLLNPQDPINGNIDIANAHFEKLFINIPLIFSYKKSCKKVIYPFFEVGINNLIFLGQTFGYNGTDFPEYPKRKYVSRKNMLNEKKYIPAISASIGFGIKIKKRLLYEFGINYNQIIIDSNNALSSSGATIKGFPYSIGFKTGLNYIF